MNKFFQDKVVCITGSSQGIGKATAILLGGYGAKIVLNGRNAEKLKAAEDELKALKIDCYAIAADLSRSEDCERLISEAIAYYGRLNVLINNAGIASRGRIAESSPANWQSVVDINTMSAINTTFYALPHLRKTKGHVILISSMAAKVGVPGHAGYSVSKMALTAYAKALQVELENEVHCGLVYVGFTANEQSKTILKPDGTYEGLKERKGLKLAKREDVARSIAQAIVGRRKEVTLTLLGKLQHILLKIAPGVVYKMLKNSYKDYDNMYS
ncbi:MAG: SDR family NAD(P)-dependent oxidoreductase [Bacteroidia bacterium]|nr:SDR family NAD(P)-dependent oxidoreductase [Bacteroidia bacterium]